MKWVVTLFLGLVVLVSAYVAIMAPMAGDDPADASMGAHLQIGAIVVGVVALASAVWAATRES